MFVALTPAVESKPMMRMGLRFDIPYSVVSLGVPCDSELLNQPG
jgi:hypothetical protein